MNALAPLLCALLAGPTPRPAPPPPTPRPPPRQLGTVAGQLRHKGCQSNPAGAVVSVIGREASTTTDGSGRFALHLPPGSYSLVIDGPNLVSDQRVDDVAVTLGQTRDLGTVEVWPEERPANCGTPEAARPAAEPVLAITPETPSLDMPGDRVAPSQAGPEQIWVRASPGTGPGQLGVQGNPSRADEDALGPPSFAVGPSGSLWVLDALNKRVVRFDPRGHALATFSVASADALVLEADLGVTEEGHVFLFHAGETPVLAEYDNGGRLLISGALPASFRGVSQLSCARSRPFFLMQNGQAVRVELSWGGLKGDGPLPGLPVGELFARAERTGRFRAAVKLATGDGRVRRSVQLVSRVPITGVRLVGADRRGGDLVVAVDRAERGDGGAPQAEVLLLSLTPLGRLGGARSVPPGARRFEFREFALAPDGTVVQMQSDAAEVRFVRWTLPPPPREAVAGEGILRGRVVENGRPAPGASVTLGRSRRVVAVTADGTFEVRLPAGTYTLSVRPVATPGGPEPLSVDIRAVVAPGATVDIGNVAVPPRIPARPEPVPAVP